MKTMQKRISAAVAALSLCAGMTSAAMPVSAYLRGDARRDGVVSVDDAQYALNAYADLVAGKYNTVYPEEAERADVNGDGALTAADAQLILLYYTANSVAQQPTSWHDLMPGAKKAGITDDGDTAHRMLSPKSHVSKLYYAELEKEAEDDYILSESVQFDDTNRTNQTET